MAERRVRDRELFWSVVWWGCGTGSAALVVGRRVVARLDGTAAGLVFGGVAFMLLGCIFTFELMPPPARIEEAAHGHDAHAHAHARDMTPRTRYDAPAAAAHDALASAAPEPVAPAVAMPLMAHPEPAAPAPLEQWLRPRRRSAPTRRSASGCARRRGRRARRRGRWRPAPGPVGGKAGDAGGAARRRAGQPEATEGRRAEVRGGAARARHLPLRPDRRPGVRRRSPGSTRTSTASPAGWCARTGSGRRRSSRLAARPSTRSGSTAASDLTASGQGFPGRRAGGAGMTNAGGQGPDLHQHLRHARPQPGGRAGAWALGRHRRDHRPRARQDRRGDEDLAACAAAAARASRPG